MKRYLMIFAVLLIARGAAADESDANAAANPSETRVVPGWPEHFQPQLLADVSGKDRNGNVLRFERAYLFHRLDVEQITLNLGRLERCNDGLTQCESREADRVEQGQQFWDTALGETIKIGLAFAAGVGITVAVAYAVGGA